MNWLKGKKTYLAAAALVLLGVSLIALRQSALGMQSILLGAAMVGLGDRANRHQAEILKSIEDAGRLAVDVRCRNQAALAADISEAASDAAELVQQFASGGAVNAPSVVVGEQPTDSAIARDVAAKFASGGIVPQSEAHFLPRPGEMILPIKTSIADAEDGH